MALGGKGYYISLNLSENYFWSVLNICDLVSLLDKHCPVTAFLSHFLNTIFASSHTFFRVFPGDAGGKESTCQWRKQENMGRIPGSGRSPGEGNGNLLQYSCLENSMDRGAWQGYSPTVHGVAESQTWWHTHANRVK